MLTIRELNNLNWDKRNPKINEILHLCKQYGINAPIRKGKLVFGFISECVQKNKEP